MSADYPKTLFDPFTREERSGTNKVQGTGPVSYTHLDVYKRQV